MEEALAADCAISAKLRSHNSPPATEQRVTAARTNIGGIMISMVELFEARVPVRHLLQDVTSLWGREIKHLGFNIDTSQCYCDVPCAQCCPLHWFLCLACWLLCKVYYFVGFVLVCTYQCMFVMDCRIADKSIFHLVFPLASCI